MSKTWRNKLLWVHYSNSHKGFCIEYELNDMILEKTKTIIFPKIIEIEYSKESSNLFSRYNGKNY